MSRDLPLYLEDIQESCARIERYTSGMSFEAFCADERTVDAVLRNLMVIGEAVKRLPAELKRAHPHIAWRKVAGLRDMLAHAYFGLDLEIVWDVVANRIPALRTEIAAIASGLD